MKYNKGMGRWKQNHGSEAALLGILLFEDVRDVCRQLFSVNFVNNRKDTTRKKHKIVSR